MAYPSHVARGALRHALRTHPQADTVLNGRRVNDLTVGNLYDALRHLNVDPDAIARNALHAADAALTHHNAAIDNTPPFGALPGEDTDTMALTPAGQDLLAEGNAIEAELQSIRSLIMTGGFSSLTDCASW